MTLYFWSWGDNSEGQRCRGGNVDIFGICYSHYKRLSRVEPAVQEVQPAGVQIPTFNLMPLPHRGHPLHTFSLPLGDYYMTTTHQISFQNPPLGQSMFPVHIQGRKIALIMHPVYMECINQYQSDFQAPGWNQVLKPDRDKSSQGTKRVTRTVGNLL